MSMAANVNTKGLLIFRKAAASSHPSVFTDIFEEDINIAIWQRKLSADLKMLCREVVGVAE